jgi:hypothetical protein
LPNPSFSDPGTYNLRDEGTNTLVGKIHVEAAATDVAGGRAYIIHYALVKSSTGDAGWGVYARPTQGANKGFTWEPTGETLTQFTSWVTTKKTFLRYISMGSREQDAV